MPPCPSLTNWWLSIQICEPSGVILIQTTTKGLILVCSLRLKVHHGEVTAPWGSCESQEVKLWMVVLIGSSYVAQDITLWNVTHCYLTLCWEGRQTSTHPAREPTTDQLKDTTKVRLDGPVSFVEVIYRSVGERLILTRAETTQRQLRPQKPTPECVV